MDSPGPIFFKQERVGKNWEIFKIYKFRTMYIEAPEDIPTYMLKDTDILITSIGRILRKTSIDELPQLINVLRGEMSLVGPRPVIKNDIDLLNEREKYKVNNEIPGLSGWAQINGRDEISYVEKAKYDAEYVKQKSLSFDLLCLYNTFFYVAKKKDIKEGIHEDSIPHYINGMEEKV